MRIDRRKRAARLLALTLGAAMLLGCGGRPAAVPPEEFAPLPGADAIQSGGSTMPVDDGEQQDG